MYFNSTREKFIFYKIPVFLFSLMPFLLITGPLLTDFSASLISLLFLIYCVVKKNFSYFKNKYFLIFLIFWVYLIFNSLVNNFNLDSLKISFFYIRFGIFVIAVTTLLEFDPKFIKLFFYCIFACFICLIIDGYYQYFKGENIFGFKAPSQFRVSSFFNDEMILGSYLSRIWPIFFALSIFFNKQKNNLFILFIIIFISSEALIFLSGDRTAFFFINISAIFVIMLSQKLYKLRLFTLCFSFLLLIIISLINPNAKERVINETLNQMNLVNKDFDKNIENNSDSLIKKKKIYIFSEQHTHHYITAYKMFLDNKILGVGVKNFRNFCNEDKYSENELSCANHPHSTYFQLLSETGIIGFLFLLFVLFYFCAIVLKHIIYKFKKLSYFTDFEICILSGLLIYIWPIAPSGNFFNNWINIIMLLNLPFIIWSRRSIKLNKINEIKKFNL